MSKAETQALTNYGSGEDENEDEEIEEFEEGPVDVQTSLQANTETAEENEHDDQVFRCRRTCPPSVSLYYWILFVYLFFGHIRSMWKFLGQRLTPRHRVTQAAGSMPGP